MSHTFEELVAKQRAVDEAHTRVEQLRENYGSPAQERWAGPQSETYETAWRAWRDLVRDLQAALGEYASDEGRSRAEVEAEVVRAARSAGGTGQDAAGAPDGT
ncbi:hypothetical protein STXM2123_471 [Streptomyces sp. F-3]|uniref:WXG100 family type VII secretion target n=1 Tax=Streptomyces thermogriseus TaxID=75292 RepID=A0ABN1T294_9ACTN|nr:MULTISPECIES: hypothetical protein [Streptomyces]MDN5381455.1 hypothetical protein [Streptomyces sp. LB8]GAT79770.1 hypothetical protein STXM2123_471 [Streptomyces sp. F-3]